MDQLKRKMSQLRMETEDAKVKVEEAEEEKKQAFTRVEEVNHIAYYYTLRKRESYIVR